MRRRRGPVSQSLAGLPLLALIAPTVASATSVEVLSTPAIMEPSSSRPSDKDGCPPTSGSADPEEGVMQVRLVVTSPVLFPRLAVTDVNDPAPTSSDGWRADRVDDLSLDEFSSANGAGNTGGVRDLDDLDGVIDGQLAVGTWHVYFNLDKTAYDQDTYDCVGNSVVGNHEGYAFELRSGDTPVASASHVVALEKTASVGQSDLNWIETYPQTLEIDLDEQFCMRSKYRQSSANSLVTLIANSYYHADNLRLDAINLYYYDTNGADPGSVETGIPGLDAPGTTPARTYPHTALIGASDLPTTGSSGDHWVSEFCFTVTGIGGSRFSPYFQTRANDTGSWKTDSGYGMQEVPVNPPSLTIEKLCDPGPIIANVPNEVVETLSICNVGLGDAIDVEVIDTLPDDPSVVFVSADDGGVYDPVADTITWNLASVGLVDCAELSFTLEVTPPLDATSIATNAGATVTGVAPRDLSIVTSDATAETCPVPVDPYDPRLAVTKTVTGSDDTDGNGALSPGDAVHYAIVVTNVGNVPVSGVVLDDDLDQAHVAAVEGSTGTWDGDVLSWSIGALAPGGSASVGYTARLSDAGTFAHGETLVPNTVTATSAEAAPVDADASVTVTAAAALAIDKRVTGSADDDGNGVLSPGDTVHYAIDYANVGNADATGVVLVDDVDQAHVAGVIGGTWDGDVLTWSLGTVAAGASGTVAYSATLAGPGVFADGATVVDNVAVLDSAEVEPVSDAASVTVIARAALSVTKTVTGYDDADGNGVLSPGDTAWYEVTYTNDGDAPATSVAVLDDPDQSWLAGVTGITGGGAWDGDVITWSVGTVAPGAGGTFAYGAVFAGAGAFVDGSTSVPNTVVVSWSEGAVVTGGLGKTGSATASASVTVTAGASLSLAKTWSWTDTDGDAVLSPGDTVHYDLSYANHGDATAPDAMLDDDPDEAWLASVVPADGGTWDGATLSWALGDLLPGASGTVSYDVVLAAPGAFPSGTTVVGNVAVITDGNGTTAGASADVEVAAAPILALSKAVEATETVTTTRRNEARASASTGGPATAASEDAFVTATRVTWRLTLSNEGTATADDVLLEDLLPADLAFEAASDGGIEVGGVVSWSIGAIAPGDGVSVTVTTLAD